MPVYTFQCEYGHITEQEFTSVEDAVEQNHSIVLGQPVAITTCTHTEGTQIPFTLAYGESAVSYYKHNTRKPIGDCGCCEIARMVDKQSGLVRSKAKLINTEMKSKFIDKFGLLTYEMLPLRSNRNRRLTVANNRV